MPIAVRLSDNLKNNKKRKQFYDRNKSKSGAFRLILYYDKKIYRSPESERLEKLLEKYHGNRNAVAAELGISTTTLWRRMKKYGIEPNYVN